MAGKRTGWNDTRRREQAARIRQQKPWEQTTGPRTAEGKNTASQNAYKHGLERAEIRLLCRLLRLQRAYIKNIVPDAPPL